MIFKITYLCVSLDSIVNVNEILFGVKAVAADDVFFADSFDGARQMALLERSVNPVQPAATAAN